MGTERQMMYDYGLAGSKLPAAVSAAPGAPLALDCVCLLLPLVLVLTDVLSTSRALILVGALSALLMSLEATVSKDVLESRLQALQASLLTGRKRCAATCVCQLLGASGAPEQNK